MTTKMEVSVIIVNYNTTDLVLQCIASLKKYVQLSFEILVIDNGTEAEAKRMLHAMHPEVQYHAMGYNAGFARANNVGITLAQGAYVLLLNSDAWLEEDSISKMRQFYQVKESSIRIGLLGCRIIGLDNVLQIGTHVNFPTWRKALRANPFWIVLQRVIRRKRNNTMNINHIHQTNHPVSVVSGACVFFRRDSFVQQQLFLDEDFFLYSEDTEWSFRVHRAGLTNYFCGDTQIRHINGASSAAHSNRDKQLYVSELLYFYKTLTPWVFQVYVGMLRFNFQLNRFLLRRKGMGEERQKLREEQALFSLYLREIRQHYKRTPNSSKHPLIYGKKDS